MVVDESPRLPVSVDEDAARVTTEAFFSTRIHVTEETKEALDRLAERTGVSLLNVILAALQKGLEDEDALAEYLLRIREDGAG